MEGRSLVAAILAVMCLQTAQDDLMNNNMVKTDTTPPSVVFTTIPKSPDKPTASASSDNTVTNSVTNNFTMIAITGPKSMTTARPTAGNTSGSPTINSTSASTTTIAPSDGSAFDLASFLGGIALVVGLVLVIWTLYICCQRGTPRPDVAYTAVQ